MLTSSSQVGQLGWAEMHICSTCAFSSSRVKISFIHLMNILYQLKVNLKL